MKNKIFKKLIAVLCAATMSMAVVAPAEAIEYTGAAKLKYSQETHLKYLNSAIKRDLSFLKEIETYYETMKESTYMSHIYSIANNLKQLNDQNILDKSLLTAELRSKMFSITESILDMKIYIEKGDNVDVKQRTEEINSGIKNLLDKIEKGNEEKLKKEKLEKEERKSNKYLEQV